MKQPFLTFPNLLSLLRLCLGVSLVPLAGTQDRTLFIGLVILAFFLDLIDGPIARWTGQTSDYGAWLDSVADFSVYAGFIIGAWWLWPDIIAREAPWVALLAAAIFLPALAGYIKFRRATAYHTWLVKFAVLLTAPASVLLFLCDIATPFRIASAVSLLAGLEELAITLVLDRPRTNVRSLAYVMKSTAP